MQLKLLESFYNTNGIGIGGIELKTSGAGVNDLKTIQLQTPYKKFLIENKKVPNNAYFLLVVLIRFYKAVLYDYDRIA